jgi:hypothetical protein
MDKERIELDRRSICGSYRRCDVGIIILYDDVVGFCLCALIDVRREVETWDVPRKCAMFVVSIKHKSKDCNTA